MLKNNIISNALAYFGKEDIATKTFCGIGLAIYFTDSFVESQLYVGPTI
jgi:hypothetical protein